MNCLLVSSSSLSKRDNRTGARFASLSQLIITRRFFWHAQNAGLIRLLQTGKTIFLLWGCTMKHVFLWRSLRRYTVTSCARRISPHTTLNMPRNAKKMRSPSQETSCFSVKKKDWSETERTTVPAFHLRSVMSKENLHDSTITPSLKGILGLSQQLSAPNRKVYRVSDGRILRWK